MASVNRNFDTFTSDDAKQVFNTILIQSTSQNKLEFLLFLSLSEVNFAPGRLSLNRVQRDNLPDLKTTLKTPTLSQNTI